MKKDIHPTWYPQSKVSCTCGNSFTVGSTLPEIHVVICHKCHPLYTGQEKLIDTEGLVQKYQKRQASYEKIKSETVGKKKERETTREQTVRPRTLREMLDLAKKQALS